MKFIPQLSSLRTIAVMFVIIHHYYPQTEMFNLGALGVDIFFFLSGFLITSLMIKDKQKIEEGILTRKKAIGNFYLRRALRIFPLYYLVIIGLYTVAEKTGTHLKENISYFVFYVPNMYFFNKQEWDGFLSHFWSLGVEEQYYLCWPFVFFFTRKAHTLTLLYGMIALSALCKTYMALTSSSYFYEILTINCMYKFGLGALIVFHQKSLSRMLDKYLVQASYLLVLSIILYVAASFFAHDYTWLIKDIAVYYFVAFIIILAVNKQEHFIYTLFSSKVLISLGVVSYGLYVFHPIVPWLALNFFNKVPLTRGFDNTAWFYPSCVIITIILSYISYYCFESFFLRLKASFK